MSLTVAPMIGERLMLPSRRIVEVLGELPRYGTIEPRIDCAYVAADGTVSGHGNGERNRVSLRLDWVLRYAREARR